MIFCLSIFINFLFVYVIIDLHYRSLEPAQKVQCSEEQSPLAKRVVLFVSDGMGAQLIYREAASTNGSFVRSIMEGGGSWGISEVNVPTMTYTGVNTISTGSIYTSINLLIFNKYRLTVDNVYNYTHVYYVGDFTALHYLSHFSDKWHITTWNGTFIDSVNKDYIKYDKFTCENIRMLLMNRTLAEDLKRDKTFFIVYMSAVDYCGHHVSPLKPQCIEILKHVDKCVGETVKLFNEFYKDNETSFLLTADHGMTDYGRHGGGHPDMRRTPILAWGAGIKSQGGVVKDYPEQWKAKGLKSIDIKQSDLASFISVLLGNPIPDNSYGVIPRQFLAKQDLNLAKALYCNGVQLNNVLQAQGNLPKELDTEQKMMDELKQQLKNEIRAGNASGAFLLADNYIKRVKEELNVVRHSYSGVIKNLATLMYTGWGLWLFLRIISSLYKVEESDGIFLYLHKILSGCKNVPFKWSIVESCLYDLLFIVLTCVSLYVAFNLLKWPLHFSVYILLSLFLWWRALKNLKVFWKLFENFKTNKETLFYLTVCMVFTVGVIVSVYYATCRKCLIALVSLIQLYLCRKTISNMLTKLWLFASVLMMLCAELFIFNQHPVERFVLAATTFWIISLIVYAKITKDNMWAITYIILFVLVEWNVSTIYYFAYNENKSFHTVITWAIFLLAPFLHLLSSHTGFKRLCLFCYGIGAVFLLFTTRTEGIGFFGMTFFVVTWYALEVNKAGKDVLADIGENKKSLDMTNDDLRRGFLMLLYTWCCYFASGFRDHPSNFEVKWTDYFMVTFDEHPIIVLVLIKFFLPFVVLCSAMSGLYNILEKDKNKFVEWYLFLNNIVSLFFFHLTKEYNEHNYEGVGFSLARHILSAVFPIFVVVLLPVTNMLLKARISFDPKRYLQKQASVIYE
ncbi:GPI ethanolamine phosphate transferase 1-like [Cimex lectularius]|uniref:GPI ethanolamine phosphate transferase 1 n=1 Tax=Cimex lectularius TaxID=79782 RepID=A0A8I6TDU6_CIMLE|nr:GPI ethanolamine phosphate transferase 1-like [Cimex lectularius]